MSERQWDRRLELALAAGREAAQITLRYFQQDNFAVELKADASPVTVADREAEQHLRSRIADSFADDAIVGEEFPEKPGHSGYRWILDPVDGTKSFVHGVPLYGTMIGVEYEGQPVIGVVLIPGLDEYVYAARSQGAWHVRGNAAPRPARVSSCTRLADALFCATDVETYVKCGRKAAFDAVQGACRLTRTWGDCYGYVLVATGRAELMIDPVMNVWDAAALQPILEEAGGTFTDWNGTPTILAGEGIATNGHLADAVLELTRGR